MKLPAPGRYAIALLTLFLAVGLRWLLDPALGDFIPFITVIAAVVLSVWIAGVWPAALVAVAGFFAAEYLFVQPRGDLSFGEPRSVIGFVTFGLACAAIIGFGAAMRRTQHKEQLRRETLRLTLASIGDGVITTDQDGLVRSLNPVAEELTGWTNSEALDQPVDRVLRLIDERTRAPVESPMRRALHNGLVLGAANDVVLVAKDGTERNIDETAAPIIGDDGVIGCVMIFRDVTAQRAAARALQQSEADARERLDELQVIYDTTPIGMCQFDPQLRFIRINDRLAEMNGLPVSEHLGRTVWEVIPDLARKLEPGFRRILETGEPVVEEEINAEMPGHPGTQGTWLRSCSPIRNGAGEIIALNTAVVDITDRKRDERRIRELLNAQQEADRRKDEFIAMLAHELRNPLAPLRSMLEVLKMPGTDGERLKMATATMERQLDQLVRLVDDLLDVSRISHAAFELRLERFDIASVVKEAVDASRGMVEHGHHPLELHLPHKPTWVLADRARLAQIIGNLITNACKYNRPNGRIALTVEQSGAEVVIRLKDEGIGIPPGKLQSVFELFTQLDRSMERTQGGLGIGLSLVRRLAELHGGSVEARSEGEGKGSEFIVRLPVATAGPRRESTERTTERITGRRFLIVDDNVDAATSLELLLRMTGNETRVAMDGPTALVAVEQFLPDIVLLDIGLPGMNGYDTCRRIRERPGGRALTIIALTGWGQEEDRQRSKQAGFDAHLVKPIDFGELTQALADLHAGAMASST